MLAPSADLGSLLMRNPVRIHQYWRSEGWMEALWLVHCKALVVYCGQFSRV